MEIKKEKLHKLTTEILEKKNRDYNLLIGIFVVLNFALPYFLITDYFNGEEVKIGMIILTVGSFGSMIAAFIESKAIKQELKRRNS